MRSCADDIVLLENRKNKLFGKVPENIAGLLEIRNVGISNYKYIPEAEISLLVNLVQTKQNLERFPKNKSENILGVEIPAIDLYADDMTIVEKIIVKLKNNLINNN